MARIASFVFLQLLCLASKGQETGEGYIDMMSGTMRKILPSNVKIEKIADGFGFTEGPVWHPDGYLLFSDIPNSKIYKYKPENGISVYLENSGYLAYDKKGYEGGSNGLAIDKDGRLIICQHGARQVAIQTGPQSFRPYARQYQGRKLNSPNDLVIRSDGLIYFTDPPWGLPGKDDDPEKELPFQGLFLLRNNDLILLDDQLSRPNGLTFSPDEDKLYVGNLDGNRKEYFVYTVRPDGRLSNKRLFFDATDLPGPGSPDGMKTDKKGFLYFTGPGGVLVLTPKGEHIGTISPPETPSNLAWGAQDGRTLYMTCRSGLYAVRLKIPGIRNWMQ